MTKKFDLNKKLNKKKLIIAIIFFILAIISTIQIDFFIRADESVESSINISVFEILDELNLSEIEAIVEDIDNINFFDVSIKDKLTQILNGNYFTNYSSLISAILSLIFGDIREILPFLFTLIGIGLLSNIVINLKCDSKNVSDIISFVFFSVMIILILVLFKNILSITSRSLALISNQIQIIFPILITLLASIGSLTTVSIYNPIMAILSTIINIVFDKFLYPIFILLFIFSIIGSLTDTVKLSKLSEFLMSTFKWTIGIVFTLFSGFMTIQGISAGKFDSISIKATKFAVKSYIPIIGSYISDGMDFFVLGSVLVKNAVGLIGVIIIFITIISPVITILIYKFALQLSSGILELSGNAKMSGFLSKCSKLLLLPIVLILGISFMYVITICLIMCTANIF